MKSNIKELDVLTLDDDKKYLVSSIAEVDNIKYLFLVDMDDNTNVKLMEEKMVDEEIHLLVVEDKERLAKLLPELLNGSRKAMNKLSEIIEE